MAILLIVPFIGTVVATIGTLITLAVTPRSKRFIARSRHPHNSTIGEKIEYFEYYGIPGLFSKRPAPMGDIGIDVSDIPHNLLFAEGDEK